MDFLEIKCHILNHKGEFETLICSLASPYTTEALLKAPELAALLTCEHKVFLSPTNIAKDDSCLRGLTEVFILNKARVTPQQWRENRLKVAKALLKKVP